MKRVMWSILMARWRTQPLITDHLGTKCRGTITQFTIASKFELQNLSIHIVFYIH
jgi:hypothetical protein